jgi:tRNA (guanine37-N1)-methyltransferase
MKIYILTLFPEEMQNYFLKGLFKKAYNAKAFDIVFVNIRDYGNTKHRHVDDYPYGHRQGMILRSDVLYKAVTSIDNFDKYHFIYPCPKGQIFEQKKAKEYSKKEGLIILSGYYEGIDERLFSFFNIDRVSMGNFVLSNGELPALMIADSVLRYVPGVLGNPACAEEDSIASGLVEGPQYTVPREENGVKVPDVVVSGNHAAIRNWRKKEALKETLFRKPNLFVNYDLKESEQEVIVDILKGGTE